MGESRRGKRELNDLELPPTAIFSFYKPLPLTQLFLLDTSRRRSPIISPRARPIGHLPSSFDDGSWSSSSSPPSPPSLPRPPALPFSPDDLAIKLGVADESREYEIMTKNQEWRLSPAGDGEGSDVVCA